MCKCNQSQQWLLFIMLIAYLVDCDIVVINLNGGIGNHITLNLFCQNRLLSISVNISGQKADWPVYAVMVERANHTLIK